MTIRNAEHLKGSGEYIDRGPSIQKIRATTMTSSDEGEEAFSNDTKRRRGNDWRSAEERDNATSLTQERFQYPTEEPERNPGNVLYEASSAEGQGLPQPDPLPPRFSVGTPEYPEDPLMGPESLLNRVQRENDNQYGFGRGLPALGLGGKKVVIILVSMDTALFLLRYPWIPHCSL